MIPCHIHPSVYPDIPPSNRIHPSTIDNSRCPPQSSTMASRPSTRALSLAASSSGSQCGYRHATPCLTASRHAARSPSNPPAAALSNRLQSNGGKQVQLEKFADVIIADHARTDAPANSVSWKYIEDCVKSGDLLNADDYKIKRTTTNLHLLTSTAPTKSTRNPFTRADDQKLLRYVYDCDFKGEPTSGKKIYEQFAAMVATPFGPPGTSQTALTAPPSTPTTRPSHGVTDG